MINLEQASLRGKRALVRADLNVSVSNGQITSTERVRASLDTVRYVLSQGASVMIISHFGRPKEGEFEVRYSLAGVREVLQSMLGKPVRFESNWIDGVQIKPGEVVLCENVRFLEGETECSDSLSQQLANLCDVYVMDAFGVSHRNHASTTGVMNYAPLACAGRLFQREIDTLSRILHATQQPLVSIVGGSKIQGKLQVLRQLCQKSQTLIVGGGIANTFLAATGKGVGRSLYEPDLLEVASEILEQAAKAGCCIPLPVDAVVGAKVDDLPISAGGNTNPADEVNLPDGVFQTPFFSPYTARIERNIDEVMCEEMILDIGPKTSAQYRRAIRNARTVIWNGPLGAFEYSGFEVGTRELADAIVGSSAFSVAGGGDTVAALEQFDMMNRISYVSTGGGAFLKYVETNSLPVLTALDRFEMISEHAYAG